MLTLRLASKKSTNDCQIFLIIYNLKCYKRRALPKGSEIHKDFYLLYFGVHKPDIKIQVSLEEGYNTETLSTVRRVNI